MFCNKCGKEVRDGAKFCPKCGAEFQSTGKGEIKKQVKSNPRKLITLVCACIMALIVGVVGFIGLRSVYRKYINPKIRFEAGENFWSLTDGLYYRYNGNIENHEMKESVTLYACIDGVETPVIPSTIKVGWKTYPVYSMSGDAFAHCTSLKSIALSDALKIEGSLSFVGCTSLTDIELPNSLRSIGAFHDCSSLKSIELPDGLESIGASAFWGCTNLTDIEMPKSLKNIGENAFWDCISLKSIELPDGLESIGESAFHGCTNLTDIKWPNSLKSIDCFAFDDCTSLQSVELPDSLESVGEFAFAECTSLTSVKMPSGLKFIPHCLFFECSGLKSVELPKGLENIGTSAFKNCTNLEVRVPETVVLVGAEAFDGCKSVVYMGEKPLEYREYFISDFVSEEAYQNYLYFGDLSGLK